MVQFFISTYVVAKYGRLASNFGGLLVLIDSSALCIKVFNDNFLHLDVSKHILHTVLCTFPKVLIRRIC